MRDPGLFDDPNTFQASRFLDFNSVAQQANASIRAFQLTDSGDNWLIWGTGRIRW